MTPSTKRRLQTCVLVGLLFCYVLSAGCSHPRGVWKYRTSSYPPGTEAVMHQAIVILPFKDSRSRENTSGFFGMPMILVPLIPYGWADYSRPEVPQTVKLEDVTRPAGAYDALLNPHGITPWQFSPEKDFAEATVQELTASRLFTRVVFSKQTTYEDWILIGELKSTRYTAKAYTYGLGFIQWFLNMLGAPMGSASNELIVEFVLKERLTDRTLWQKEYHETKDVTFFLYWKPSEFYYDELFNGILQDVVKNLRATLLARKSDLPDSVSALAR